MSRIHWLSRAAHGKVAVTLGATAVMVSMVAVANAQVARPHDPAPSSTTAIATAGGSAQWRNVCAAPLAGQASCMSVVARWRGAAPGSHMVTGSAGSGASTGPTEPIAPDALVPADLQAAYHLPSATLGKGETIAIVDAYDDPNAESDLAVYRKQFHLPACTTASGCFRKVAQDGSANYPPPDLSDNWEIEESLDVDMASAICPNCKIMLVEANDPYTSSLAAAEDTAAKLGANVISNSYGAPEGTDETSVAKDYNHPGVVTTASTGDWGFGVYFPAAFSSVVAVGGTSLYRDSTTSRGWSEQAWAYAGSGCSVYVPKPAWQHDKDCAKRSVADVSAEADFETPVYLYDTYQSGGTWFVAGGTSVSSPIIAGVYALAGNTKTIDPHRQLIAHSKALFDVTGGSNGFCGGGYLCTGMPGYDGPTGWGTPNGLGAF